MLHYSRLNTNTFMDTMFASSRIGKSIRGNTTCQVFVTEFGHVFVVPMDGKSGKTIASAIKRYFKEIGVPNLLICDRATEQVKGDAKRMINDASCTLKELEKCTPQSNLAERTIKILKDESKKDMFESNCPMVLWDYAIERRAKIICSTTRSNYLLDGHTPHTKLTGQPTDISNIMDFGWYEWVIYRIEGQTFPFQHQKIGRTLGPATHAGNVMLQWVLTGGGEVMPIQTLRRLTDSEMNNPSMIKRMNDYDEHIQKRYGECDKQPMFDDDLESVLDEPVYEQYESHYDEENHDDTIEIDDLPDHELFLNAEVMLPRDGPHLKTARVINRTKDKDGNKIGSYHPNPILNTQIYDVLYPDGSIAQLSANLIAENIYNQIDDDGYRYQHFRNIIRHKKESNAVPKDDCWVTSKNGNRSRKHTTKVWYFEVEWLDGSMSWVSLKDLKVDHPIELAEYCQNNNIMDEAAITWWAPHVIKKKKNIIGKVKSRSRKNNQKYGIAVPRNVKEALEIDRINQNTLWRDAIAKEMKNVRIAFDILDDNRSAEPGRTYLECYLIFDVKMDFTRKARFVANGSKTPDLLYPTYAGVVSRETVRIAFTYAALHDLDVMAGDIQNSYLTAPISEKYWMICSPEFGPEIEGCKAIIVRALYGTKTAGKDFRNHLRGCMDMLGYKPCYADPDLWMRYAINKNGEEYYEFACSTICRRLFNNWRKCIRTIKANR